MDQDQVVGARSFGAQSLPPQAGGEAGGQGQRCTTPRHGEPRVSPVYSKQTAAARASGVTNALLQPAVPAQGPSRSPRRGVSC